MALPIPKLGPGAKRTAVRELFPARLLPFRHSLQRLRRYRPHISFSLDTGTYLVKTVENGDELEEVLHLRHAVFYEELLHKKVKDRLDVDVFDLMCDHLGIVDKATGSFVATYRMNSSRFNRLFYSSTEFDMRAIGLLEGGKLELGRACSHRDFRKRHMVALLWQGLSEYVRRTDSRYLFGCSSVMTTHLHEIIPIHLYLWHNFMAPAHLRVSPRKRHRIRGFAKCLHCAAHLMAGQTGRPGGKMSPLLMSYLRAGAVICGEPAIDRHFRCVDFFTLLDMTKASKPVGRRFLEPKAEALT
jgi:putative hemolysin